jgi:hypothetical protein
VPKVDGGLPAAVNHYQRMRMPACAGHLELHEHLPQHDPAIFGLDVTSAGEETPLIRDFQRAIFVE